MCNHPKLVLLPTHPEFSAISSELRSHKSSLSEIEHGCKLPALKQLLLGEYSTQFLPYTAYITTRLITNTVQLDIFLNSEQPTLKDHEHRALNDIE